MIICNHAQPRLWREEEVELLQAVGDQLAIAMDQARLYEQSRTKAQEFGANFAPITTNSSAINSN